MNEFNEALFKTKVDNIFIQIHTAITTDNLDDIKHFLSNELYLQLNNYLNNLKSKNQRQIYDEINVKNTYIKEKKKLADRTRITVNVIARYMDYIIDINNNKIISGQDTKRIEKIYTLVFEKKLATKELGLVRKCPNCGASLNINASGKCPFCKTTFNLVDYDYILVEINKN